MDILTLSDLLGEFVKAEKEILNQYNIKHPTTIGAMYEGLTENVLNSIVFKELNLKVVKNSFIKGCQTEFDVLLVVGNGEQIRHTNRYIYTPENVVAIIQVKKNLYSKDIAEGYENLKFIIDHYNDVEPQKFIYKLFRDSFKSICKKEITANESNELTEIENYIYGTLKIEAFLPVRIIWGYNGFTSEKNLRTSFIDYLKLNLSSDVNNYIPGFGPQNFPNLIICDKFSLFKMNAMPFIGSVNEKNRWTFYASSSYNPTYYFLEVILSRLSYMYDEIPIEIFGEDLTIEPATKFIECSITELNGKKGWEYNFSEVSNEFLKSNIETQEWKPVELDEKQHIIISELCVKSEIDLINDKDLNEFITEGEQYESLDEFITNIKKTGLVYVEHNKLKLLTEKCLCIIMPNGKFYAEDNKTGRLTRWMIKEMDKSK